MKTLSIEEIEEYEQIFQSISMGKKGSCVPIMKLATVMRLCGTAPTNSQIEYYADQIGKDLFSFGDLLDVISLHLGQPDSLYVKDQQSQHLTSGSAYPPPPPSPQNMSPTKFNSIPYRSAKTSMQWIDLFLECFSYLDHKEVGEIEVADLEKIVCEIYGDTITKLEFQILLEKNNISLGGKISLVQFIDIFTPEHDKFQNVILNYISNERQKNKK